MRIALDEDRGSASPVVRLKGVLPPSDVPLRLRYLTRTGALLRVGGAVAGAFDREHRDVVVRGSPDDRALELDVERAALPTNGLPPGDGIRWRLMTALSHPRPRRDLEIAEAVAAGDVPQAASSPSLPLWGHSHLDVAWLWTYDDTRRKAARTFANALACMDADPAFSFIQSQPQLYQFVRESEPELYDRVRAAVRRGSFDPSVAALWVEPDMNIPSGESMLRQMLAAHRFCLEEFGIEPSIAWLPDSFGFARSVPSLLAHAGIRYFATTKLRWNDTTQLPYAQFRWRGLDGSEVIAALIASYDGGIDGSRVALAKERREPLVVGYGDGGGGPTLRDLGAAPSAGRWESPSTWFERLALMADSLPVHEDELYLEYHRGVYTTHHDIKRENAALERDLAVAEELVAWCVAVRTPGGLIERLRRQLGDIWEIVLRNQFHDVLPGTSIARVYDDVREEYARARALLDATTAAARATLPRSPRGAVRGTLRAPVRGDDGYVFDNGILRAVVSAAGTLTDLRVAGGRNVVAQANVFATYRDRPAKWDAWNVDAGYDRSRRAAQPQQVSAVDSGLEIPFRLGDSVATMRVSLREGDPFLRVDASVDWRSRHVLLRVENWFAIETDRAIYGAPHGHVVRSARRETAQERAKFEVPGQRYALACDANGSGIAIFALDTYGWSARALAKGGISIGHSLLRSPTWPDPNPDRGVQELSWAYAPIEGAGLGSVERAWERFALEPRVRLFRSESDAIVVVACKPAEDGRGAVVRVRECEGETREMRLVCGARMRAVEPIDALERPATGQIRIESEAAVATIPAYALRSYRVLF